MLQHHWLKFCVTISFDSGKSFVARAVAEGLNVIPYTVTMTVFKLATAMADAILEYNKRDAALIPLSIY